MHIREIIAKDLDIPQAFINEAIVSSRKDVKIFDIPKKSGGIRRIFHPSKKLKMLQYWLVINVFKKMPVHDLAKAYREGVSILHNAAYHRNNRFFIRMDFKDFFPSITFQDFLPFIEKWYLDSQPCWELNDFSKELIRNACFFKEDRLAIGYPSSPIISNIVMYDFDARVSKTVSDAKYGNMLYTRYADDLVFSTDKRGACRDIKFEIENVVRNTKSPILKLNTSKTRIGSSTGGKASVTGLRVCSNGHITINRKQKDHIRLLLSLFAKGKLNTSEYRSLLGHLGYCQHVAPQFYTTLSNKFFKEIHTLRGLNP